MEPRARNNELGSSKLNLILTLAVLGAMAFAGVKIVPAYVTNYQLQDAFESECRFALSAYPKKSPDDIRQDIWKEMQELGIPAKPEDIRLSMSGGLVAISLDYSVPVDLEIYQFILQFHPHADNHTI